VARFVLQPCKLRQDRLVPKKNASPIELTWRELCEKLAPSRDVRALKGLYWLQPGSYVGLLRHPRNQKSPPVNFVFVGQGRTGVVSGLMAGDPTFVHRLLEVYRVDVAERETACSEPDGVVHGPIPAGAQ